LIDFLSPLNRPHTGRVDILPH